MRYLLIDDHGELWSESSDVIRKSFASKLSDDGTSAYLVKNLGFIAVDFFGTSAQIRLRPAILSQAAFETLATWLRENDYQRIALTYYDRDWHFELFPDTARMLHRLLQLVNTLQLSRPSDFIAQSAKLDTLQNYPALRSLIDNWDHLSRELAPESMKRILRQLTRGRYVIVRRNPDSGRLVLVDTGDGYRTHGREWAKDARGTPVEQQPDLAYGTWINSTYEAALRSNEPIVQDVDAIVATPEFGRYRLRYKRLMLANRSSEQPWLLCSSALDERIDLRLRTA